MADEKNDKPMSALERYLAKQKADKARAQAAASAAAPKDKSRLFARAEAQAQAYADSKNKPPPAAPVFKNNERPNLSGIERPEPVQPPSLSKWESVAESRLNETEVRAREAGAPVAPPPRDPASAPSEIPEWKPVDEWRPITDSTLNDGIPNADFGVRFIATLIDWSIVMALDYIAQKILVVVVGISTGRQWAEGLNLIANALVIYGYYGYFYSTKGASPGKLLLGLEVTGLDGVTRLTPWRAFFREGIGKFISAVPLLTGYIIVMIRADHRALHDLLFDTRVVRRKGSL
jgi:uncharacterized RDD family membrane protein YckC